VRLSRVWTVNRAREQLDRVLESIRPDAVVTHDCWPHVVFGPTARRVGVNLIHFAHGLSSKPGLLERLASRTRPDLVIANSRFTATRAQRLFPGVRTEPVHYPIVPYALDESPRNEVRRELGTAEGTVVIFQASRLERWKGHSLHLAALGKLRDVAGWECWIAGGTQKTGERQFLSELTEQASRLGIADRVRFLGQRSDVPRLMASADIYCQPNTGPEPFGLAFVEALHAGLPVVTARFGGPAEIVDKTCGFLTPPGDAEAVAAALRHLIQHAPLRQTMSAAAREHERIVCSPARQINILATFMQTVGHVREKSA
jgi:glycosyltransferase involved in cell wall biosynthesis